MKRIVKRRDGEAQNITIPLGKFCGPCPACCTTWRQPSFCRFTREEKSSIHGGEYYDRQFEGACIVDNYGNYQMPIPEWCPLRNGASILIRGEIEKI